MHIAARVAVEVLTSHGDRTQSRLRSLVEAYGRTYGIAGPALEPLQDEALKAASRLHDFRPG